MATKIGRMVTYLDGLLPINSHDHLIMRSGKAHMINYCHYIFNTTVPMATIFGLLSMKDQITN